MLDMKLLNEFIKAPGDTEKPQKENRVVDIRDRRHLKEKEVKALYIEQARQIEGNMKTSERLRAEINKDISDKKPIRQILDKAILTISLMTGDSVFYKQNSEKIKGL